MNEFSHPKKRRCEKSATPDLAVQRQTDMAKSDTRVMYAATVGLHRLKVVKPAFDRATTVGRILLDARRLPLADTLPPETTIAITNATEALAKAIDRCNIECATIADKLRANLQRTRLAQFQIDFAPTVNLSRVAEKCDCMLCGKNTRVLSYKCCGQTKLTCQPCATKAAFHSSQWGTKNEASCPFCRAKFAVYTNRKRKLSLIDDDNDDGVENDSHQDESK